MDPDLPNPDVKALEVDVHLYKDGTRGVLTVVISDDVLSIELSVPALQRLAERIAAALAA